MFTARVVEVAIALPVDHTRMCVAIEHALHGWNSAHGHEQNILLVPSGRAVDRCDVFIAVVDPVAGDSVKAVIGDALHVKRAGRLTLVWFLTGLPTPDDSDAQIQLNDLARQLSRAGIVPRHLGPGDFLVESRLHAALTADLTTRDVAGLTAKFDSVQRAPEVLTSVVPAEFLGPGIWAVTVHNSGPSLVTGLTVAVDAVDAHGKNVPDGVIRSAQAIAASEFFAALRTNPWRGDPPSPAEPGIAVIDRGRRFLAERVDVLAAHTALAFPHWLRSGQHSSALYSVAAHTHPRVRIEYHDDAGIRWSRTDGADPQRIPSSAPPSHTDRSGNRQPPVPTNQ